MGSFPEGASAAGCLDMVGNVWEWAEIDPRLAAPEEGFAWVFGGSFRHPCNSDGKIARSAVEEIPWVFDAAEAKKRSGEEKRPILLYVRCVDEEENIESAQSSLRAEKISSFDDGLKKDLLFRTGPLSDPAVSELIRRRYVPVLVADMRVDTIVVGGRTYRSITGWSADEVVRYIEAALGREQDQYSYYDRR